MSEPSADSNDKKQVLFICTGNTCRSVMAEFIARKYFGKIVTVCSAGFRPQVAEDAENAIYTLKKLLGIDASRHRPRDIHEIDVHSFDLVVTMDGQVAKQFKEKFKNYPLERLAIWKIKDPWGDDLTEYEQCARKIYAELKRLPILKESE